MKVEPEEFVHWMAGRPLQINDAERLSYITSRIDTNEAHRVAHGQFKCCWGYVHIVVDTEPLGVTDLITPFVIGWHESIELVKCILLSPMLSEDEADKVMIKSAQLLIECAKFADERIQPIENLQYN